MKNITMEPISAEEAKMYRSRISDFKMKKPNFKLHYIVSYSIVALFLIVCFLFAGVVSYIN